MKLAEQLIAAAPDAEWNAAGVNRADELAAILERSGVRDLAKLRVVPVRVTWKEYAWSEPQVSQSLAFTYDGGPHFGFMGTPTRHDTDPVLQASGAGLLAAWSPEGDGNINYAIKPVGQALAIVPIWGSSSDLPQIRAAAKFIVSVFAFVALPLAGINAAAMVGQTILGPALAAEYPMIAQAVGQVVVSTATNGGDVSAAMNGLAGTIVGFNVAGLTDSQWLGNIAASAARAQFNGDDPVTAARAAALQFGLESGVKSMIGYFDDVSSFTLPQTQVVESFDFGTGAIPISGNYWDGASLPAQSALDAPLGSLFNIPGGSLLDNWNPAAAVPGAAISPSVQPNVTGQQYFKPAAVTPQPAALDANSAQAWAFATTALKMLPYFLNKTVPPLVTAPAAAIGAGGYVNPASLPVGQPTAMSNGTVMLNNGNGTYTVLDSRGQSVTRPMPSTASYGTGLSSLFTTISPGMVLAGAGLLVLLMRRR